jgi:hypothetical protein
MRVDHYSRDHNRGTGREEEVLSRHWTSDGIVTYVRRAGGDVVVTVAPGPTRSTEIELLRAARQNPPPPA